MAKHEPELEPISQESWNRIQQAVDEREADQKRRWQEDLKRFNERQDSPETKGR